MRRDVFQAIADPTRREIISLLAHQSLNLNSIAENFDISRPAISKHVRILAECGMVAVRTKGRERYCRVDLEKLKEVAAWVEKYKRFWAGRLDTLQSLLEAEDHQKEKNQ